MDGAIASRSVCRSNAATRKTIGHQEHVLDEQELESESSASPSCAMTPSVTLTPCAALTAESFCTVRTVMPTMRLAQVLTPAYIIGKSQTSIPLLADESSRDGSECSEILGTDAPPCR